MNRFLKWNFQKSSCLKLQGPVLSYLIYNIIKGSLPKLFKLCPWCSLLLAPLWPLTFSSGERPRALWAHLFSISLNDIKEYFMLHDFNGVDLGVLKLLLLLHADDTVIMSKTYDVLIQWLLLLEQYCDRWKLTVKDARSVSLYLFNRSQILQYVKYTK